MTKKERLFVEYYDRGDEGRAAIKKAGFKSSNIIATIRHLLNNKEIQEAIVARDKNSPTDEQKSTKITPNEKGVLVKENLQRFWSDVVLSRIEQTSDKLKASELLGKSHGLFIERLVVRPEMPYVDYTPEELALIAAGVSAQKIIDDRKKSEMIEFERK